MGNISSANFKKSKDFQVWHNADIRPNYAIGGGLEVNRNGAEALELKNQIIKQAIDTYNRTKKPKAPPFKAKSYEWSLVVNLKADSTMHDLETLSAHFKEKYGFQCYQIAIHRDEGHIDELGNKRINHHAHLEFVTLDEHTGKNRFRGEVVTAKGLRAVQDEVAQILKMERGADKRLSGAKRIEPRAYGAMKQREKAERKADLKKINDLELEKEQLLSTKEVKEALESFRKQCIGNGLPKEFFRALSAEKQSPKQSTKQELELFFTDLLRAYENEREERENAEKQCDHLEAEIGKLEREKEQLEQDILVLKNFENNKDEIITSITELESKTTQNRTLANTKTTAPIQPKSTETTQSVETIQKTEPKIDAPIEEQNQTPQVAEKQAEPQEPQLSIEEKMRSIDEAIAKTNTPDNQAEIDLDMPKNDVNDNRHTKPYQKR